MCHNISSGRLYNFLCSKILNNVQKVKFEGISGTVAFSSDTGDRMALTMVEQLVDTKYQIVGYYDMRTDNLTLNKNSSGQEVIWWRRGNPL